MTIPSARRLGALCALAGVVCIAPAVHAQAPEKLAQKSLKSGAKDALKTLNADLKQALATFLVQLGAFDVLVKDGDYSTEAMTDLLADLNAHQALVVTAVADANTVLFASKHDALQAIDAADALDGIFPVGFYEGDRGSLDGFQTAAEKALAKTYLKLRKRLAKTANGLEKQANVAFTFRVRAPLRQREVVGDEVAQATFVLPLTLDLLAGVSELGEQADGLLYAAGTGSSGGGFVNVQTFAGGEMVNDEDVFIVGERWSYEVAAPETSHGVSARQGTGSFVTDAIGVR